jgi:hypothetical protein
VHHQVGAELDRPAQIRRGEGGIDQERHPGVVGDLGHGRHVQHLQPRITENLGQHQPGLRPHRGAVGADVARVDEAGLDAEARQGVGQQVDGPAIQRRGRHDMPAGAHQSGDRQVHGGLAAGRADRADAALERGDALLEDRDGGVADARVDVAGALQVEQRRRVVGRVEHVGGGLVYRHRARPGRRVGLLPGVQAQGVEAQEIRPGHGAALLFWPTGWRRR